MRNPIPKLSTVPGPGDLFHYTNVLYLTTFDTFQTLINITHKALSEIFFGKCFIADSRYNRQYKARA